MIAAVGRGCYEGRGMNRSSNLSPGVAALHGVAPGRSRLQQILESGRFALTAEITPPASSNLADLLAKAAPLKGLADAVNVTDGAGARAHLESTVAASVLLQNG